MLNLHAKSDVKGRDISVFIEKIFSQGKKYLITISEEEGVICYDDANKSRVEPITTRLNNALKNTLTASDMVVLLKKYGVKDKSEAENPQTRVFGHLEFHGNFLDKKEEGFDVFYDFDKKVLVLDPMFGLKTKQNSSSEEEDDDYGIVHSDEIIYTTLENLPEVRKDADGTRNIFPLLENYVKFTLQNDIQDINIAEGDFPYFVRGESNITDERTQKLIEENLDGRVLTKLEIESFLEELDKISKTDNIVETIREEFACDFAITVGKIRLRVNAAYKGGKEISIEMRTIKSKVPRMEDLGLIDDTTNAYKDVLSQPFGMIFIVGPTGSGKSYSLTSMIGEINRTQAKRIITLEDPIEFAHSNIKSKIEQKELGVDITSYAQGLRSALRQKPHIILCGEIRDKTVMELAMEAASTGHVVFATFHANDVVQTIQRIVQMFPHEQQEVLYQNLSEILLGVFVQKLVPCKTGGKILIKEIMINNANTRKDIYNNDMKSLLIDIEAGSHYGMITNDMSIKRLFDDGKITAQTAYDYAKDKEYIAKHTQFDRYITDLELKES